MIINKIIEKAKNLTVSEQRYACEKYYELVFPASDQESWLKICEESFGPPVKPAGIEPSPELKNLTRNYGFIRANQILFSKENTDNVAVAIFMPWENGNFVTLKLAAID